VLWCVVSSIARVQCAEVSSVARVQCAVVW
jgi:hypothetical protein